MTNNPNPVLDAAQRRSVALINKDVEKLLELLDPNFIYVNANCQVLTREQYLDLYVRSKEVEWISQEIDDPRVIERSNTAVLTCLVHDVARFGDVDLDETFRSTFTWVKPEHDWRCLGGQTSRLP